MGQRASVYPHVVLFAGHRRLRIRVADRYFSLASQTKGFEETFVHAMHTARIYQLTREETPERFEDKVLV